MSYINSILWKIKDCYGVYIGIQSVYRLAMFLGGFQSAVYEIAGEHCSVFSEFQLFVEKKFGLEFSSKHWSDILSMNTHSPSEAFELFFVCWEECFSICLQDVKKLESTD